MSSFVNGVEVYHNFATLRTGYQLRTTGAVIYENESAAK